MQVTLRGKLGQEQQKGARHLSRGPHLDCLPGEKRKSELLHRIQNKYAHLGPLLTVDSYFPYKMKKQRTVKVILEEDSDQEIIRSLRSEQMSDAFEGLLIREALARILQRLCAQDGEKFIIDSK